MVRRLSRIKDSSLGIYRRVAALQERERRYLQSEFIKIGGLMPLLMKPRNKLPWSKEDRAELRAHMRRLSDLSPYLMVLLLPGSFALLPALAWWLDRRRNRRVNLPPPGDELQAAPQPAPAEPTERSPGTP